MRIVITGSTGLIGTALKEHFQKQGHAVSLLVRPTTQAPANGADTIEWDILQEQIERNKLEGHDAIIHLAGASIAGQRWTPSYKKLIASSRVEGTKLLVRTLRRLQQPPAVLVCASAVGYYGSHPPEETLDEKSPPGEGFLADVCREWEQATEPLKDSPVRVAHLRFGMVLSAHGGALARMLPPFRFGLGGPLGHGRQMISWIALPEIPGIVEFVLKHSDIAGAINATAPHHVSNREFTRTLGRVLHRPAVLPVPGPAVRLLFGEMGQSLLLEGASVRPEVLLGHGYVFRYPHLGPVLRHLLRTCAQVP